MITTTELSILESQSQKIIYLDSTILNAIESVKKQAGNYHIIYDTNNTDIKKLLINQLIISVLDLKKTHINIPCVFCFNKTDNYQKEFDIITETLEKIEFFKKQKSINLLKNLKKYLKQHNLQFLLKSYFQQPDSKLALYK